ncbi:hypothetical protein IF1G_03517 [Cordyceps javanica]|uniref:Uncharacterized protein n=1 Tax=Cordyceps javanica TaxID=43265 RepID=A0A545V7T1_9HYPO|nr:hypothetical protein IF1G_03517 [Cordyceps javanica]
MNGKEETLTQLEATANYTARFSARASHSTGLCDLPSPCFPGTKQVLAGAAGPTVFRTRGA